MFVAGAGKLISVKKCVNLTWRVFISKAWRVFIKIA